MAYSIGNKRVVLLTSPCQKHEKVYSPYTCTMCWHCRLCGATGCDNMAFALSQTQEPEEVVYKRWDIDAQQWVDTEQPKGQLPSAVTLPPGSSLPATISPPPFIKWHDRD